MTTRNVGRLPLLVAACVLGVGACVIAAPRTWTDVSGRFAIEAELVDVSDDVVRLRKADGEEVSVPLNRLSKPDREFLTDGAKAAGGGSGVDDRKAIEASAETFFKDLRTTDRKEAQALLTAEAAKVAEQGKSPLTGLPKPDEHTRAIRVGRVRVEGGTAEAPVVVRAGGAFHKTKLHFRQEGQGWRVFAISAEFPDGEKTIDFESPPAAGGEDPLLALVGKELDVHGVSLAGQPLNWKQFEGKVVLVDFWATWCGPCRAEMPNIRANWDKHHAAGFEVVAVSVDRDMAALQEFVAQEKPPWTVVADRHPKNRESMAAELRVSGIPAFVLIGRDGKVAAVHCRGKRLGEQLEKLLGDPGERVAAR
ncbi:Thiol-disulfide oxidoreductase ResA [Posidoniimonas polymericola]|uniref:Thiol-disulfide oxidoreductase ResA n=1 Tax=Posidoniimonas polymericola TaxID=2528002 RepID=A0A5C5YUS4_9BACT|nr:redoxin family protein [Posidoniimonas polymericola]TWT78506.1 Thiol-disulfide oxidoreductase ResA [Posidoniimonas polymericola]